MVTAKRLVPKGKVKTQLSNKVLWADKESPESRDKHLPRKDCHFVEKCGTRDKEISQNLMAHYRLSF